jgi:hypothetical protein
MSGVSLNKMRHLLLGIPTIAQYKLSFICTVIRTEQDIDLLANFLCKLRVLTVNSIVKCRASCLLKTASRQIAACMVRWNQSTYCYVHCTLLAGLYARVSDSLFAFSSSVYKDVQTYGTMIYVCAFLCSNISEKILGIALSLSAIWSKRFLVSLSLRSLFDRENRGDTFFREVERNKVIQSSDLEPVIFVIYKKNHALRSVWNWMVY